MRPKALDSIWLAVIVVPVETRLFRVLLGFARHGL
jgi:hypothetical protein